MATPTIAVKVTAKGSDDVRAALDKLRQDGNRAFAGMAAGGKNIGTAVSQGMDMATSATQRMVNIAKGGLGALNQSVTVFSRGVQFAVGQFNNLTRAAGISGLALSASFGASYYALRSYTLSVADNIEAQYKLAKANGISMESLTRWQSAVRITGGTGGTVASTFNDLYKQMVKAATGSEDAMVAFTQLDIAVRKPDKSLKSVEELIEEVSDKLAEIENPTLRAKAAFDLLGGGANDLLPVLERGRGGMKALLDQVSDFGTQINADDAKRVTELNERRRRLSEALKGIGQQTSIAFLPVFTEVTEQLATWLQKNSLKIRRTTVEIGGFVRGVQKDMGELLSGEVANVGNGLLRAVGPGFQALRDITIDLFRVMRGADFGTLVPWLKPASEAAKELGDLFVAAGNHVLALTTGITGKIPDAEAAFAILRQAIRDVRIGFQGLDEVMLFPSLGRLGRALSNGQRAFVELGGVLLALAPTLIGFADTALVTVADGFEALRQVLMGTPISAENFFAFANEIVPYLRAAWETIAADFSKGMEGLDIKSWKQAFVDVFKLVAETVGTVYRAIRNFFTETGGTMEMLIGLMDRVAKAMGLKDWKQLGIVLALGYITGMGDAIGKIVSIFATLAVGIGAVLGSLWTLIQIFVLLGKGVVLFVGLVGGIPAAIIAGVAAALIAIWYFWDEIVAGAKYAWGALVAAWEGVTGFFGALFTGIGELAKAFWDGVAAMAAACVDAVVGVWQGIRDFFARLWNGAVDAADRAWSSIKAMPKAAWDALVGAWSGLVDFFTAPLRRVAAMFRDLWEGIKSGASSAWGAVKSMFGFGGGPNPDQAANENLPSFDVGGYIPGARGAPLKMIGHGGERVLNLAETGIFESIMSGLASLTDLPQTAFAQGPVAEPAGSSAPSPAMMGASFDLNGRRIGGFQGSPGAVRELRMAMAKSATSRSGPMPRWYGGY